MAGRGLLGHRAVGLATLLGAALGGPWGRAFVLRSRPTAAARERRYRAVQAAEAGRRLRLHPRKGWRGVPATLFRKGPHRRARPLRLA